MEVMEDGNLMDKVTILIQRDLEYYKKHQAILQETICPGIIGGKLDFPRSASFASMKLVLWWEEEYLAAFRKPSGFIQAKATPKENLGDGEEAIVKASDPGKFVSLITKSAEEFLEHLNVLSQEALDHADLTVLTGTIGASALLKNCMWFYIHQMSESEDTEKTELQTEYKQYNEMCEALAERLLDLHIRLIALYILQDADCLHWESTKPFFENERGSYVIQMWWLYMKGTKDDLWSSVPPKMAQRVFAGMLNESLTILTVRYTHSCPSEARTKLILVDLTNLLLSVAQLLPAICDTSEEFAGVNLKTRSKMLRDIHVKCQNLLFLLLIRGAPLDILYKTFKNDKEKSALFRENKPGPLAWVMFSLPNIFKAFPKDKMKMTDLDSNIHSSLELMVLTAQPQANWSLLYKLLRINNLKILELILSFSLANIQEDIKRPSSKSIECAGFLCTKDGSCKNVDTSTVYLNQTHYYDLAFSATYITLFTANNDGLANMFLAVVTKFPNWAKCFERRNVWNQIRPPWFEAILSLVSPIIPIVSDLVINALKTDATMYQAMSLTLAGFGLFYDGLEPVVFRIANLIQDYIPSDVVPLGGSCLLQILVAALYSHLIEKPNFGSKKVAFKDVPTDEGSVSVISATEDEDIRLAVAEALCSIDEENQHTDQIEEFLEQVRKFKYFEVDVNAVDNEDNKMFELLVSDLLMTADGCKSLKYIYHFIKNNTDWLYQQFKTLEDSKIIIPNRVLKSPSKLLTTMFHIGDRTFDEFLIGKWKLNWQTFLQQPMNISGERMVAQLSLRWEFRNPNSVALSEGTTQLINNLNSLFKQ